MNRSDVFDLETLRNHPWIDEVIFAREMASTNDVALELNDHLHQTTLVLTEQQSAGRGRGLNRWESSSGTLTYSIRVMRNPGVDEVISFFALATGLAIMKSANELTQRMAAKIKWPNDVLLDGQKLSGVLIESNPQSIIIGIGTNVYDTPHNSATHLSRHSSHPLERQAVLINQLDQLSVCFSKLIESPESILDECGQALIHRNKTVSLTMPDGKRISGLNTGLGPGGEILIQQNERTLKVVSAANLIW